MEQNFWIATLTNLMGIVLAVPGWMSPVVTGALHVGHSLSILINSGRILGWKPALNPNQKLLPEKTDDA